MLNQRFWLTYRRKYGSRLLGVVIIDSTSIDQAHMSAAAAGIDGGGEFVEGQEVDRTIAKLIPVTAVGRMLEPDKAHKLLDQFERRISRRAP